MKQAIEVKNVVKKYDSKFELGNLNLSIPGGMIVGLIGENGAGKTTFIKSLLKIIQIDKGEIHLLGKNYQKEEKTIKEDIGVVLDGAFYPEILTPNHIGNIMKDIYKNWDSKMFKEYMEKFFLPMNKPIKSFSTGMRKKLEIITALSHHPKLLILDEPTSGLDPVVRSEVLDLLLNFIEDEDHTVLLSTHITSDLEHVADRIIFLNEGKIILDKNRDDLMDNYGILKCTSNDFDSIDKKDIICYRKNKYDYEILVCDKEKMKRKYNENIIDNITLEDLMVLMIKGEKRCLD